MPPRGRKASAKKAKGPSPRSKRSTPQPEVRTDAVEENAVPEPEVPSSDTAEENAIPEPEPPLAPSEEEKAPEPEAPLAPIEEEKAPEPEAPLAPIEEETAPEPEAVGEKEVPEPEAPTSSVGEAKGLRSEVGFLPSDATNEEEVMEDLKAEEMKEELTELRDHASVDVVSEMRGVMLEEAEGAADGVNEGDDMQVDQEQGTEQESVEKETAVEGENIRIEGDAGADEGDKEDVDGGDEGDEDAGAEEDDGEDDAVADEGDGEDDAGADEVDDKAAGVDKDGSDVDEGNEDSDEDDEEDHSIFMQAPLSDKKKQKDFEIFIGGLDREAVEDDLVKVFGAYGEIQSVRIVKHPTTQKSKGFAFIRYATIEQAKKVLADLKDGIEVRGKRVGLSASQDNDTLYLGNICKTWTKDNVIAALKGYGIEQIDEIILPEDPKNEGRIKGYAFVEFSTHSDAMAAFQRLRKPDAIFGCDRSAKVAFAPSSMHPSEEILSQVKTVFIEGLPESWDEAKVMEHCKQYGEVEKVQLSRYFTNARRRDFGFVAFTSRESAVACVVGINNTQIGEGQIKVKANIAKPQNKGRLAKQGARGGFKVKKDGENTEASGSKMKGNAKFKQVIGKGQVQKGRMTSGRGGKSSRPQGQFNEGQGSASFQHYPKREQPFKGGKRNARFMDNARPSKRARDNRNFGNVYGRPGGNRNNPRFGKLKKNFNKRAPPFRNAYPPAHGAAATGYHGAAYGPPSGSKRSYPDMEPHAGYVHPAGKQARGAYGYGQGSAGGYDVQGTSASGVYSGGAVPPPSQVPNYSGYTGYEAGYGYPNNATYPPPSNAAYAPPNNVAYAPPNNAAYLPPNNAGYPPPSNAAYPPPSGAYY